MIGIEQKNITMFTSSPHLIHYGGFVRPMNQIFLVHHPDTWVIVVNLNKTLGYKKKLNLTYKH